MENRIYMREEWKQRSRRESREKIYKSRNEKWRNKKKTHCDINHLTCLYISPRRSWTCLMSHVEQWFNVSCWTMALTKTISKLLTAPFAVCVWTRRPFILTGANKTSRAAWTCSQTEAFNLRCEVRLIKNIRFFFSFKHFSKSPKKSTTVDTMGILRLLLMSIPSII